MKKIVYLKIPVGKNANEDTKHNSIYKHGRRQCSFSRMFNCTRDVFYVRREVDLMKTAKLNAYIMHIFGKIELLSIYATQNYFKMHYFNVM